MQKEQYEKPGFTSLLRTYAAASLDVFLETLWPTRCCLCEVAGALICEQCRSGLSFLDQWFACPRCGAPFGMIQCTECNETSLAVAGRSSLPFSACVSAVHYDDDSSCIVRTYKDAGERGLADFMGYSIACAVPPEWVVPDACVVPVPATAKAKARRGFDHGLELAQAAASYLDLPCEELLVPGKARDQRRLRREQRLLNVSGVFSALGACAHRDIIVVDDVYTTGATACAAADALGEAGARSVRCATFAHVY